MKIGKAMERLGAVALMAAVGFFFAPIVHAESSGQGGGQGQQGGMSGGQGQGGQGQGGQAQGGGQGGGRGGRGGPAIDPAEENGIKAFNAAADADAKIQAGEDFDQKFPNSHYAEAVDSTLVTLYFQKQDWTKFYAEADKVLAKDPDNAPILAQVGWVIPHAYQPNDPSEPAQLDKSEKYEKHALEVVAAMQKPAQMSDDQFNQAKASLASMAHSGLGLTYFRRNDFTNSAKELESATTETPEVDPSDLYILGLDYQKLNRNTDAAQAFTKCSQMPGDLQAQCQKSAASLQGTSLSQ